MATAPKDTFQQTYDRLMGELVAAGANPARVSAMVEKRAVCRRPIARTWYRRDASGYRALAMDSDGKTVSETKGLTADALPAGVAVQCDALQFASGRNSVEVWAA